MKRFLKLTFLILVMIFTMSVVSFARDVSYEENLAGELKSLGIFRGVSDTDFDLDRAPSRVEALVMLVRILGVENEVNTGVWRHPFTDVPSWANNYVGYAYSKGLTNGQSGTEFGTGNASAAMYLTFVLRALGYSDVNGMDFTWNNPYEFAKQAGIVNEKVNLEEFLRADVVVVSHSALSAYLKGSDKTLAEKLIEAGVFTSGKYKNVYGKAYTTSAVVLTSEQIYATCSSSVFFILGADSEMLSSGSGFFINDAGVAITNYHVIDGWNAALIQTTDENVYEILGVYEYSKEQDWAVIQVDCKGNDYLTFGDEATIVGGAPIYTIGSPEALQNTISEGIISNASRYNSENDVSYIQITAPVSHGSSGGALINKYGEVIGITSAIIESGQNLNLAIPVSIVDISLENELVALSEINPPSVPVDAERTQRTFEAFSVLKAYVEASYNETLDDGQECYYENVEFDDGIIDAYIYYDEEYDDVTMNLMFFNNELFFDYYMSLDTYSGDSCLSATFLCSLEGDDVTELASGFSQVDKASFKMGSKYSFYEFKGEEKEMCEQVSSVLHSFCLAITNEIFSRYAQTESAVLYSVYDFGYVNFEE